MASVSPLLLSQTETDADHPEAKRLTDKAVDQMEGVQNLRKAVYELVPARLRQARLMGHTASRSKWTPRILARQNTRCCNIRVSTTSTDVSPTCSCLPDAASLASWGSNLNGGLTSSRRRSHRSRKLPSRDERTGHPSQQDRLPRLAATTPRDPLGTQSKDIGLMDGFFSEDMDITLHKIKISPALTLRRRLLRSTGSSGLSTLAYQPENPPILSIC